MTAIARKQIGLEAKEPYCIQSLETFGTISRMVCSTGKVYSTLRASDEHQSAGIHFWSGARMKWISLNSRKDDLDFNYKYHWGGDSKIASRPPGRQPGSSNRPLGLRIV